MSGHSKWSTIKRKKAATDQKRGNLFTKLVKEITIAARIGGGDPESNPRLRLAIDNAKSNSMPAENIKRAIQRGTGEIEGATYDEITYEGYGPGGIAILIDAATDNRNRTVAEIRHIMSRNGGSLGESGSVSWSFQRKGSVCVAKSAISEDDLMDKLIDAGLEDLKSDDDEYYTILSDVKDLEAIKKALEESNLAFEDAKIDMIPDNTIELDGEEALKAMKLIEALEENDDVQTVFSNLELSEEAASKLN